MCERMFSAGHATSGRKNKSSVAAPRYLSQSRYQNDFFGFFFIIIQTHLSSVRERLPSSIKNSRKKNHNKKIRSLRLRRCH